ncbi:MAG: carboxylating nicotinate-nucleotide diphosphorylase [Candidatus Omnitrophota bacterium]
MIIDTELKKLIQQALREDIGGQDVTTNAIIHKAKKGEFLIAAKEDCVICGLTLAEACFEIVDDTVRFKPMVNEGKKVSSGKAIAFIDGRCCSILAAERTALNFLTWLSGISTMTNSFLEAVKETKAQIMDTRKTIPTLRGLEKYAVKVGGGTNHRMGLYDQVLIKDNHLAAMTFEPTVLKNREDAVKNALESVKGHVTKGKKIEIEVDSIDMLKAALRYNPDIVMLDNMSIDDIKEAVKVRDAYRIKIGDVGFKVLLEVSGNVNIGNVREIAECGVDMISVGALTHSAPSVDISLEAR